MVSRPPYGGECADSNGFEKMIETVINMSSNTTVHVVGWPRWMRESVTSHPQCEDFGVQQVGSTDSIPPNCNTLRMENRTSETEFRKILTGMDSDVTCVVFSEGVDADGTEHEGEVVTFRRLGDTQMEGVSLHPLTYHFRRWSRMKPPTPTPSQASPSPSQSSSFSSLEPSWLTEAEVRVETEVVVVDEDDREMHDNDGASTFDAPSEPVSSEGEATTWSPRNVPVLLSDIPEHRTTSPSGTPPHSTYFNLEGTTALTLDGVITPAILTSLAQSNTIVYLPTPDGIRTSLTRVRNAIWIGAYTVDPASWNVEDRTYRLATRTGRTQIAPRRTVAQLHRLKRRQFERR